MIRIGINITSCSKTKIYLINDKYQCRYKNVLINWYKNKMNCPFDVLFLITGCVKGVKLTPIISVAKHYVTCILCTFFRHFNHLSFFVSFHYMCVSCFHCVIFTHLDPLWVSFVSFSFFTQYLRRFAIFVLYLHCFIFGFNIGSLLKFDSKLNIGCWNKMN